MIATMSPGTGLVAKNVNKEPVYQSSTKVNLDPQDIVASILSGLNLNNPNSYIQSANDIAMLNTETSQAMAREQMAYQTEANAKAMDFSATEAQKTRDWEKLLSDTAHQREVRDLIAAGLNPVLSANQGASTPSVASAQGVTSSGAKGSVDTGTLDVLSSVFSQMMNYEMQMKSIDVQNRQIDAQLAMNEMSNTTNKLMSDNQVAASMYNAGLTSSAQRYAAGVTAGATQYAALLNSEAARYSADKSYEQWEKGLHNNVAQTGQYFINTLKDLVTGSKSYTTPKTDNYYMPYGMSSK